MEKCTGYGDRIILESIKLNGARLAAYRRNWAQRRGKSTLIKLLAGELEPLHGEIGLAKALSSTACAQHQLGSCADIESPLQHMARLAPQELEQKHCATISATSVSGATK